MFLNLHLLLCACLLAAGGVAADPGESVYDWHVTLKHAAPDCFAKEIILVNGVFQPTITIRQGDVLQVRDWVG